MYAITIGTMRWTGEVRHEQEERGRSFWQESRQARGVTRVTGSWVASPPQEPDRSPEAMHLPGRWALVSTSIGPVAGDSMPVLYVWKWEVMMAPREDSNLTPDSERLMSQSDLDAERRKK